MVKPAVARANQRRRPVMRPSATAAERIAGGSFRAAMRITITNIKMAAACNTDITTAPRRSPIPKARSAMSLSIVLRDGPPSTRTTANDEKQ